MLSIKINIWFIVLFAVIVGILSLLEFSTDKDNSKKSADTIIRSTVNKLFTAFKIQESNQQHKLKQFFAIYDLFVSITLKDCDNLKEIIRLSRVNDIDNTQHLIAQINEVLNESDKSSETNDSDTFIAKHIEPFIGKLKYLKNKYGNNKKNNNIKATFLSYLNPHRRNSRNVTKYNNSIEIKVDTEQEIGNENETISNFTEYWRPSGRRIYRGFRTRIKHFPFMASVQFFRKFQCAGSIIKNDLVITSASCLQLSWNNRFFRENPAFLSVQIGSDFYEHGGENIAVQEVYFHPGYDPKTLKHNLALMRLSRRIAFKKKHKRVRKIDIDRKAHALSGYDHITVVGWGARDSSNIVYNVLQNRLAYANLDLYPLDECREHYTRQFVFKQNFCAGFFSKGSGACNRDAGGPAIIGHKLVGVISFGAPVCGSPDSPTVFTKLGYYADWIDEIMEQDVPSVYKRTTRPIQPELIFTSEATIKTREVRFTPVIPTSSPVPDYIDDLRMVQKEKPNDFLSSQEIGELSENNNPELNENKSIILNTHKQKVVTIKNFQTKHIIDTTPAAKNKLKQQKSDRDGSISDSAGMSIELVHDVTTQATIKLKKQIYKEESDGISIEIESEIDNDLPAGRKDDSSYDAETSPESLKQSSSETTFTLPPQKVNDDGENLNKVSTITVHSANTQPVNKFTMLQFYEIKSSNAKNTIKRQKIKNVKKQKIRNYTTPVKQKMKTITSVTTVMSLNKSTVQGKHKLNRQFDEYGGNDESINTDTESIYSHLTEDKNKSMDQQFNISDDVIKRYVMQILNVTNNKEKKTTPKLIVKSRTITIASNIVLPSKPIKPTNNELKQRQYDEDRNKEESMEAATKSVHHTTLKKITQPQFDVGISDDVIKEYIMQYLNEKNSIRKVQFVIPKRINIISTNIPTRKVENKLKQKPFIEDSNKIVETETESFNDELTYQELNVGGSHNIINMNKKQEIQILQNKEKGHIKKVQMKSILKTTPTTTALVTLDKSTAHTKNKLGQLQFYSDTGSLNDERKQQQFNAGGNHSLNESITAMTNFEKGVNVRDIKADIMALIDNLDMEQLLDEVDDTKKDAITTGESNDTKKDFINLKQWTSLKYLFSSDENETRVSVPTDSLKNLSLADLPESIEYNKIPKSIFFELVSLAVEEEIKRKANASKAIRNPRHYSMQFI